MNKRKILIAIAICFNILLLIVSAACTTTDKSDLAGSSEESQATVSEVKADAYNDFGTMNGVMNNVCTGENGLYAAWRGKIFYFDFVTKKTVQIAATDFLHGKPLYFLYGEGFEPDYQYLLQNPGIRFYQDRLYYCQISVSKDGSETYALMSLARDGSDLKTVCSLERAPKEFYLWKDQLFYYYQLDDESGFYIQNLHENQATAILADYECRRLLPFRDKFYFCGVKKDQKETMQFRYPLLTCDQDFQVIKQSDHLYAERFHIQKDHLILTLAEAEDYKNFTQVIVDPDLQTVSKIDANIYSKANDDYTVVEDLGDRIPDLGQYSVFDDQGQKIREFTLDLKDHLYFCLGISSHYIVIRDHLVDQESKGIFIFDVLDTEQKDPLYIVTEDDMIE